MPLHQGRLLRMDEFHEYLNVTSGTLERWNILSSEVGGMVRSVLAVMDPMQRSKNFCRDEEELQRILASLVLATKDFCVSQTLCGDTSILTDLVYTKESKNIERTIRYLCGLVT